MTGLSILNQTVTPIATSVSVIVSSLELIHMLSRAWWEAFDLGSAFFSITIRKDQKQFWDEQWYTFIGFPKNYVSIPSLCHNMVKVT